MAADPGMEGAAVTDPRDFDKQMAEVWARVQASGGKPRTSWDGSLNLLSTERDLMQEALRQARARFDAERVRWKAGLEQRDALILELRAEKAKTFRELEKLRNERAAAREDDETRSELQAIEKAEWDAELNRRVARFQAEIDVRDAQLRDAEESRRMDAERAEAAGRRWKEREASWAEAIEKRDAELADLKIKLGQGDLDRRKDRAAAEDQKRAADSKRAAEIAALEKAKQDLQAGLDLRAAELENAERLLRQAHEELAATALQKRDLERLLRGSDDARVRLDAELQSMREGWEVERGHWRELWERERASREQWRAAMQAWEESLRREREDWLSGLAEEAAARKEAAAKVDATVDRLRTVAWSFPLFFKFHGKERNGFRWPSLSGAPGAGLWFRRAALTFAGAAGAVAAVWFGGRTWLGPAEYSSPTPHVSGLAVRGEDLWLSDWMSGQLLQASAHDPSRVLFAGAPSLDFHPVAVTFGGERLWTLDSWARSVGEHSRVPPFALAHFWPLSAESPVDMAWDGHGLWILDRHAQSLRRFSDGAFRQADREIRLPGGWDVTAIDFLDGEFWGWDESARVLRRFTAAPEVKQRNAYRLPVHERTATPLTGLRVTARHVWTMSEKSLTIYRWSRKALFLRSLFH